MKNVFIGAFLWSISLVANSESSGLPKEIEELQTAFLSVPGVSNVGVDKHYYSKKDIADLNEIYFGAQYADLPIAMFRRSNGNLEKELLISVEFEISRDEIGLKALEFLSWWVRDSSRSGDNVQIRSIGLPPIAGENIQLGKTLRFWFEAYIVTEREDMRLVLNKVGELANSLSESVKLYEKAFKST